LAAEEQQTMSTIFLEDFWHKAVCQLWLIGKISIVFLIQKMEKRHKKNITSTGIKIKYLDKEILGPMESKKTNLI
jgi:hypothetical protein